MKTNSDLMIISLDKAAHDRTCGYWYLVHCKATSHTAFATREGLENYLQERGLALDTELPAHGEFGTIFVSGSYREPMHMDKNEFYSLVNIVKMTRTLSNGSYTLAIVTQDNDGIRTVHTLNPNVKDRVEFDYTESRKMIS